MIVYVDGHFVDKTSASVTPDSQGFLYGFGIFETLKVVGGRPLFIDQHLDRLRKGCKTLNLQDVVKPEEMKASMLKLLKYNALEEGRIRLNYFKKNHGIGIVMECSSQTYDGALYQTGIAIGCSDIRRNPLSPLSYIKSMNYAENILAREQAVTRGYHEAMLLNIYGHICEGSVSNLFWVREGTVYTPSLECGVLAGTVRGMVLNLCREKSLPVIEGAYTLEDIDRAEEVFATNALMGVMPVRSIENKSYNSAKGKIGQMLREEYEQLMGTDDEL